MAYVVLARKYRPRRFEEVVGQEPVARTLKNAIGSGRVAHAYLFTGPRGVGKTSMARILAAALNCTSSDQPVDEPCGECASCGEIFVGEDVDVREIDGASNNSVEDVRELRDNAIYRPAHSRYKIYIIDEVHMLSMAAFNALLKTLEEPPSHVKFIFATTEPNKLPETIHSRCQRFDFRNISTADIVRRLKKICGEEGVRASDDVLAQIARRARGGMRDSQSLLDQIISYEAGEITREAVDFVLGKAYDDEIDRLLGAFREKDAPTALRVVGGLIDDGQDLTEFLDQLTETLRTLMVIATCGRDEKLLDLPAERLDRLAAFAGAFSLDTILYMLQVVAEADRKVRSAAEKRIVVETAVVKLAHMEDLRPLNEILERLREGADASPAQPRLAPAKRSAPAKPQPPPEVAPTQRETEHAPAFAAPEEERPPMTVYEEEPANLAAGPLGDIQKAWPRLLALIKAKHKATVAALLVVGRPVELEGGTLVVEFPPERSFNYEQLSDRDRLDFVESCLEEIIGRRLAFKLRCEKPVKPAEEKPAVPAAGRGDKLTNVPGVKRAVEIFGGRVIEEE